MCRTQDRTAFQICSHLTECAEDRIKQFSYLKEYADGPNNGFCTPRSAQETRIRTTQSARTQVWQSLPSGDGAINQDTEHNSKDDDNLCCEQSSTSPDGLTKGQLLNRFCGHQGNLTTLLDLCTDDKTAQRERGTSQDAQKQKNKGHGSTFLKHVFNNGRDTRQAKNRDQPILVWL